MSYIHTPTNSKYLAVLSFWKLYSKRFVRLLVAKSVKRKSLRIDNNKNSIRFTSISRIGSFSAKVSTRHRNSRGSRNNWRKLKSDWWGKGGLPYDPLPERKVRTGQRGKKNARNVHKASRDRERERERISHSIEPFDVSNNRHGLGNVGIIDAGFTRFAARRVLSCVSTTMLVLTLLDRAKG